MLVARSEADDLPEREMNLKTYTRLAGLVWAGLLALSISACGAGVGDIGGDGSQGANCGSNGVELCPPLVGDFALDVAVADFNGDGRPDVAVPVFVGDSAPSIVGVYLHVSMSGDGYQPRTDLAVGKGLTTIAAHDLDGDGRADLVVTGSGGVVSVLFNDAARPGTFKLNQTLTAPLAGAIALDDLNGDGRPDLVIAGDTLYVAMQDAGDAGRYAPPVSIYPSRTGFAFGAVAIGDLNGDGEPDIVVADDDGVQVVFLSATSGAPTVASSISLYTTGTDGDAAAVAVADIDGDGKDDIVITDSGAKTIVIFLQNGAAPGTFRAPLTYALPAGSGSSLAVADLTGDGHLDLVTGGQDSIDVLLHDPGDPGHFLPAASYSAPLSDAVAVADLNGDGLPDIVTNGGAATYEVDGALRSPPGVLYQNRGDPGHFGALQNLP